MKILQVDHKVTHYTCHVIGFEAHLPSSECGDVFLTRQKSYVRTAECLTFAIQMSATMNQSQHVTIGTVMTSSTKNNTTPRTGSSLDRFRFISSTVVVLETRVLVSRLVFQSLGLLVDFWS